jgi:hypothetical protein
MHLSECGRAQHSATDHNRVRQTEMHVECHVLQQIVTECDRQSATEFYPALYCFVPLSPTVYFLSLYVLLCPS